MSTLVTGAHGLLGSGLVAALLERGEEVVVLRRAPRPRSALVLDGLEERCTVVDGDLLGDGVLGHAVGGHGIGAVFHLAAQSIVARATEEPAETFDVNVRGTWLLLDACRRHGVGSAVLASSHRAARAPLLPYDASKAAAELVARSFAATYGLPVATLRLANVYGGGDAQHSRLVPEAVGAALAGREAALRSGATARRDLLHVSDAVAAALALRDALGSHREELAGAALDAGTGTSHAVGDVVALAAALVRGADPPPAEPRPDGTDAARLRELTGWRPEVSLEDGLRRTIAWHRAHPDVLGS